MKLSKLLNASLAIIALSLAGCGSYFGESNCTSWIFSDDNCPSGGGTHYFTSPEAPTLPAPTITHIKITYDGWEMKCEASFVDQNGKNRPLQSDEFLSCGPEDKQQLMTYDEASLTHSSERISVNVGSTATVQLKLRGLPLMITRVPLVHNFSSDWKSIELAKDQLGEGWFHFVNDLDE